MPESEGCRGQGLPRSALSLLCPQNMSSRRGASKEAGPSPPLCRWPRGRGEIHVVDPAFPLQGWCLNPPAGRTVGCEEATFPSASVVCGLKCPLTRRGHPPEPGELFRRRRSRFQVEPAPGEGAEGAGWEKPKCGAGPERRDASTLHPGEAGPGKGISQIRKGLASPAALGGALHEVA